MNLQIHDYFINNSALYVIDMQKHFLQIREEKLRKLISNCKKVIKNFKDDGRKIVVVKWVGYGEIHHELVEELKSYDNVAYVTKSKNSAFERLKDRNLLHSDVHIIGVNLGACVLQTAIDMSHKNKSEITIYKSAVCNSWDMEEEDFDTCKNYKFKIK